MDSTRETLERMIREGEPIIPRPTPRELGILGYIHVGMGVYRRVRNGIVELVLKGRAQENRY